MTNVEVVWTVVGSILTYIVVGVITAGVYRGIHPVEMERDYYRNELHENRTAEKVIVFWPIVAPILVIGGTIYGILWLLYNTFYWLLYMPSKSISRRIFGRH